jgi:ribonuclease P/MRP protein subunit POP1
MQSAAIQVEAIALQGPGGPGTPAGGNTKSQLQGQYSTAAAMWDNGKITLRGNPLKLLKENWCINCKLPRLMFPLTGIGARIPDDTSRQFCTLHPFINKPGHDIYGNPFPVDPGKTKKEREALRKLERQEKDNTPGSAEAGQDAADGASATGGPGGLAADPNLRKLMAGGKGASYVPWHTCPSCKRSLLITKFAQHLEKCMGIGGRSSRNAAAARLGLGNGSSAAGSNAGSRTGTPTPSVAFANGKREADDDDDDGPPKKKVRKERKDKKERGSEKPPKLLIKIKANAPASKASAGERLAELDANGKRDREDAAVADDDDDEDEDVAPKKKLKVSNEGSPTEMLVGAA